MRPPVSLLEHAPFVLDPPPLSLSALSQGPEQQLLELEQQLKELDAEREALLAPIEAAKLAIIRRT